MEMQEKREDAVMDNLQQLIQVENEEIEELRRRVIDMTPSPSISVVSTCDWIDLGVFFRVKHYFENMFSYHTLKIDID